MSRPATVRELRAAGYPDRTVKEELRANLLERLGRGEALFPSIVGFDDSVLPALERGILAGHDLIMLGERGQAKTRLIRRIVDLLDEEAPAIAGCEVNDHPFRPICARCRALVEEDGDARPDPLDRARRPLRGEARDPGHERRRPDRRRRPDPRRRGPVPRRRAHDPLRADPADQPRHRRGQRAPRPARADPGRAVQHPRGARRPDPRLPDPAAARPPAGRDGEPRRLHAPRPDRERR